MNHDELGLVKQNINVPCEIFANMANCPAVTKA